MGLSYVLLSEAVNQMETVLDDAALGLVLLDRVGPLTRCVPAELLHHGVNVRPTATANTGQYRDDGIARVQDRVVVEMAYLLTPTAQRASRDEALVLEEQIRRVLTGASIALAGRLRYVGTGARGVHPADASWWITTMTYTLNRDALLGG